eukprot:752483-Hanusia_phi.AAC.1
MPRFNFRLAAKPSLLLLLLFYLSLHLPAVSSQDGTCLQPGAWFVAVPAYMETGGPEALHQLCDMLRRQGREAHMLYLGPMERIEELDWWVRMGEQGESKEAMKRCLISGNITAKYSYLSCQVARRLPSGPCEVLVLPEVWTRYVDVIPEVRKVIWWLSVDNNGGGFQEFGRSDIMHITNSHYGLRYLREMGASDALLVNDYVPSSAHLLSRSSSSSLEKEDIIAFNPRKGLDTTMKVMAELLSKKWEDRMPVFVPVQHLKHSFSLLNIAKVYLDFGHHPGQDKIPREAAMAGCVVLTGRQGSADFFDDVPLPDMLKFESPTRSIDQLFLLVRQILANHSGCQKHMQRYVEMVRAQEQEMLIATGRLAERLFPDIEYSSAMPDKPVQVGREFSRGAGAGGESLHVEDKDDASAAGPVGCAGRGIDEEGCVLAVWPGTSERGARRVCRAIRREFRDGSAEVSSMAMSGRLYVPGAKEEERVEEMVAAEEKKDFCESPLIVIRSVFDVAMMVVVVVVVVDMMNAMMMMMMMMMMMEVTTMMMEMMMEKEKKKKMMMM